MSDEVTKRAAQLLLKGAKMLQTPCPICHEPIYQLKDGAMICVRCDRPVEFAQTTSSATGPSKATQIYRQQPSHETHPIQEKINQLSIELQAETDPEKIIKLAETIRKLENILNS